MIVFIDEKHLFLQIWTNTPVLIDKKGKKKKTTGGGKK
jgi:hypothetical protein